MVITISLSLSMFLFQWDLLVRLLCLIKSEKLSVVQKPKLIINY